MCFAAPMDLGAGLAVTGIGVASLRVSRSSPRSRALAALPLLFGVHQLVETFVWWDLQGRVCHAAGLTAEWIYLAIALLVVPILVPYSLLREDAVRPAWLAWFFVGCGVVAVATCAWGLRDGEVPMRIDGHHIAYTVSPLLGDASFVIYLVATCGPGLLARSRSLRLFAVLNLAGVGVVVWAARNGTVSLWCFWAALISVLIYLHLRAETRSRR
ncbi:hypothetical protein GCM10028801_38320 [Nocardioides maradonensis]